MSVISGQFGNVVEYLESIGIFCSEQQKQAILGVKRDTLLLAVPGSGKTTVLVSRIAQMLLYEGYKPNQILALTYNRAAAKDITRRFTALFGKEITELPRFSTVHSLCYNILGQYAQFYRRQMPKLLDGSSVSLRPQTLLRKALAMQTDSYFTPEQIDDLLQKVGCSINRMENAAEQKKAECGCKLDRLIADYTALKQQNGLMDFDDMQTFALSVLQKLPDFRKYITTHWKWIFLDEAQDASLLQHKIISLLSEGKKVFFVGDEDQTIYDFRGASPKQLLAFPKLHPDSDTLRLEVNYRCPSELVSGADTVIRYNKSRFAKNMTAHREGKNAVKVQVLGDYSEQVEAVVGQLRRLRKGKTAAVLSSHNISLLGIAEQLAASEIPYYRRDQDYGFSSHPAVRGFIGILMYAAAPKDKTLFEAAAKSLWFRKADIAEMAKYLVRFPNGFYAGMVCELSKYEKKHASETANAFSLMQKQTGVQIYETVMETLRYQNCLVGKGKSADDLSSSNALAVFHLRRIAERCKDLNTFLLQLQQTAEFESELMKREYSAITLSTIHGAKGLEFDEVYLIDAIEGCLPSMLSESASAQDKTDNMEGQTRLFYVAVTRAKQKLTLYTASKYWGKAVRPSRFIGRLTAKKADRGQMLKHQAFGLGEILSQNGDLVTVAFENGVRTLQLEYCIQNGIMSFVQT